MVVTGVAAFLVEAMAAEGDTLVAAASAADMDSVEVILRADLAAAAVSAAVMRRVVMAEGSAAGEDLDLAVAA